MTSDKYDDFFEVNIGSRVKALHNFEESKHPRANDGKFSGSGDSKGATGEASHAKPILSSRPKTVKRNPTLDNPHAMRSAINDIHRANTMDELRNIAHSTGISPYTLSSKFGNLAHMYAADEPRLVADAKKQMLKFADKLAVKPAGDKKNVLRRLFRK